MIDLQDADVDSVMAAIKKRWGIEVTREYAEALLTFVIDVNEQIMELQEEITVLNTLLEEMEG